MSWAFSSAGENATRGALRIQMALQKPLYHLARARSIDQFRQRRALYFSGEFPPVERDGTEGERLSLANVMAMNYGFAFRLAVFAALSKLLSESFGATSNLVVDSPHNSIYEEEINGETAVVHRHNAARAYPASRMTQHAIYGKIGQALLLPGTNRTSSYLCVAGEGAHSSLYSASHGAGSNIKDFVERGLSGERSSSTHDAPIRLFEQSASRGRPARRQRRRRDPPHPRGARHRPPGRQTSTFRSSELGEDRWPTRSDGEPTGSS